MKLIGIVLIIVGLVALATGGFSYTKRDKAVDLGPVEVITERHKSVPLSPIVGIAAIASGIALIAVGSRTRV